ncbi:MULTISPECIES: methyltransferase domain-containing protein [unclassified Moorena]|uniref:methyltransferase domain-containing protein n=1 Tax=unclassified Moorena TaxID=2683338 RepID=UPI0013C5B1CF|nr:MULTISPECIES: methyltransferase domain-containing protein [unclassified Moorena]NEO21118.1 methyltransferase domain-containing protein [Moorena sp. SIO4A5]NEP23826.1 methyltransferase domain-containing protein [Moorena sp. SIO3I6]NEQ59667.1 methyltransferase domain-containing protein [Moorena sp. SIO4A1]
MTQTLRHICWCGNTELTEFSPDYLACSQCGTLVSKTGLRAEQLRIKDDNHDFYGKEYWLSYQTEHYGFPDIRQRARQDLPERCLYWLRTLMAYKLPPAKVLELGCAHGGFVAMMGWAGFEAMGLELSPWVVEFAQQTFNMPILSGPLEDQQLEPESFDAIVLYDVMEHLPDPVATISHGASLLKEDGIFIVQMPNYEEGKTYSEMVAQKDHFLKLMQPIEHIHLLSRRGVSQFFKNLGFEFLQFEQQLFDYDMFFVASRQPFVPYTDEQISYYLLKSQSGRMVQALLDKSSDFNKLKFQYQNIQVQYQTIETRRAELLKIIEQQGQEIASLRSQVSATVTDLQQTKSQLIQAHSDLQHTQSQLNQSNLDLQDTQSQLNQSNSENEQTQSQLTQIHSELQHTQSQLAQSQEKIQHFQQNQLQQIQNQLNEAKAKLKVINVEIAAMKTSKFWKLRSLWFKFKGFVGLPTDNE